MAWRGTRLSIAVIGNLAVDRVEGESSPRVGGGVFWAARAAVETGADATIITRCAPADRDVAYAPLATLGVPVTCGDATTTAGFSFHYEGDRRVMRVDAVGDPWTPDDVTGWASAALEGTHWIKVAGLLRSDFPPETIAALAHDGDSPRRLMLDAQGITRLPRTGPLTENGDVDRAMLAQLAILKMNQEEAEALAGGLDAGPLRALGVAEVVLTLGSRGAVIVTPSSVDEIAPRPTTGTVDPTGAGDAFSFVYLDARSRGASASEAGNRAAEVVARLVSRP